jgi:hypothetical protein
VSIKRQASPRFETVLRSKSFCVPVSGVHTSFPFHAGEFHKTHRDAMQQLPIELDSHHPLEVVEHVATTHDWAYERSGEDEVTILVKGRYADYQVSFTWMHDIEALHLACAFDMKVPDRRQAELRRLIAMINEQMWVGHFDMWSNNALLMYRHALLLNGGLEASSTQCETMLTMALESCERYFPALQFVIWAGRSAQEAMEAALFETSGEA